MATTPTPSRISWLAAALALGLATTPTARASSGPKCKHDSVSPWKGEHLFVWYRVKRDCDVLPNYPKPGVKGQKLGFRITAGTNVIWRYNVNDTWALVSSPSRAYDEFPWWGFVKRSCIGLSIAQSDYAAGYHIPTRKLQGRSCQTKSGYRGVDFHLGPETVARASVKVKHRGTMRDGANFVVGHVFAGWHVDVTHVTRSNGHWVYVYAPAARRWGYIERDKLED